MTRAYSNRARNTKDTQMLFQTSMALVYATGGRELLMLEVVVDMASKVVMVSITLAGADLWSSQKDIQDTKTVMKVGM